MKLRTVTGTLPILKEKILSYLLVIGNPAEVGGTFRTRATRRECSSGVRKHPCQLLMTLGSVTVG
jgi:hypothetical protein